MFVQSNHATKAGVPLIHDFFLLIPPPSLTLLATNDYFYPLFRRPLSKRLQRSPRSILLQHHQ